MSDYEKINYSVKKNIQDMRILAIKKIIVVLAKVLLAMGAIIGLKAIGFISTAFMAILLAIAVVYGTFKVGYISRDIMF